MKRICGNCVYCLIAGDGERLCPLGGAQCSNADEDGEWITGRHVYPEDECIYPEDSEYASFRPVEPMVNMARIEPGWFRKPNSRVLLKLQEGEERVREKIRKASISTKRIVITSPEG